MTSVKEVLSDLRVVTEIRPPRTVIASRTMSSPTPLPEIADGSPLELNRGLNRSFVSSALAGAASEETRPSSAARFRTVSKSIPLRWLEVSMKRILSGRANQL
jgi:hypothetical protein